MGVLEKGNVSRFFQKKSVVVNFATTAADGKVYQVEYFVIVSRSEASYR